MNKKQAATFKASSPAEKPISLAPLSEAEVIRGLLAVKPVKGEQVKRASKKRKAKKPVKGK